MLQRVGSPGEGTGANMNFQGWLKYWRNRWPTGSAGSGGSFTSPTSCTEKVGVSGFGQQIVADAATGCQFGVTYI